MMQQTSASLLQGKARDVTRFLQHIINEREFYAQGRVEREKRRAERAAYREDKRTRKAAAQFNIKLGAASPWDSDDNRYLDAFIETSGGHHRGGVGRRGVVELSIFYLSMLRTIYVSTL